MFHICLPGKRLLFDFHDILRNALWSERRDVLSPYRNASSVSDLFDCKQGENPQSSEDRSQEVSGYLPRLFDHAHSRLSGPFSYPR